MLLHFVSPVLIAKLLMKGSFKGLCEDLRCEQSHNCTGIGWCQCSARQVRPLLVRSICNLSPGKSISVDATFRLAKIATGDASCIVFILGELGHIVAWAALRSDKWSNLLPVLYG